MVRGMAGQGFGLSILVTWSHSERTYDGKKVLCMDIFGDLTGGQDSFRYARHPCNVEEAVGANRRIVHFVRALALRFEVVAVGMAIPFPPEQIRKCRTTACGSCLGYDLAMAKWNPPLPRRSTLPKDDL